MYGFGYRIADGFKIGKVGQLAMVLPLQGTSIFIDRSEMIQTKKENEEVKIRLSPKNHSVIVARESYYPWKKDFRVPSSGVVSFSPLFVSQNPSGNIVTQNDPEYKKIISQINKNVHPTKNFPKKSMDGKTELWVEENNLKARNGGLEYEIIKPEDKIRNADFYKERSDAVIFSAGRGVFVIEIDKENTQNFMPLYMGEAPTFVKLDPNFLYILDVSSLMQVVI